MVPSSDASPVVALVIVVAVVVLVGGFQCSLLVCRLMLQTGYEFVQFSVSNIDHEPVGAGSREISSILR